MWRFYFQDIRSGRPCRASARRWRGDGFRPRPRLSSPRTGRPGCMTVPRRTLARAAYDNVRAAVLDGTLAPGTRVTVRPLAEQLGLKPHPPQAPAPGLAGEGFSVLI